MENDRIEPVSVTRYVLAGLLTKMLVGLAFGIYTYQTGREPPNVSTAVTFLSAGVGLIWYSKSIARPMITSEIVWFGAGTAVADFVFSLGSFIVATLAAGQPLNATGIDNAMFDGVSMLSDQENLNGLMFVIVFALLATFGMGAFLAWIVTRKLPRKGG